MCRNGRECAGMAGNVPEWLEASRHVWTERIWDIRMDYILGIDQSTQGTKAILFDEKGNLLHRTDRSHAQLIDERGWVEHDPE